MDKFLALFMVLAITGFLVYNLFANTEGTLLTFGIVFGLWQLHKYGFIH